MKLLVNVTTPEQFYNVARYTGNVGYGVDGRAVVEMFDVHGVDTVIMVEDETWLYTSRSYALKLDGYGKILTYQFFEYNYLGNRETTILTHKKTVENLKRIGASTKQAGEAVKDMIKKDMINSPNHYNQFSREVIDTMKGMSTPEEFKGFLKLNAVKYLSRYQGKNGAEDLDKAIWYIEKLKEEIKV